MAQTNKQKQDKRKERLQAAAERDGFETWSQALTAWWKGEARLTLRAVDLGWACAQCGCSNIESDLLCGFCDTPRPSH
jgi:rubrerythrin